MNTREILMFLFQLLGGLSMFIYGMNVMTASIRAAAGSSLRNILAKTTRSPLHGLALGTTVGFLAHSAAAVTMIAGFINAGIMSLNQSIAPVFGANIGTSLSSQVMSFNIADWCWVPIGAGFLLQVFIRSPRWKKLGVALIGFGLLFLGMKTISSAIAPHRDLLAPYLAHIRGDTLSGRLFGVLVSTICTAIMTSSGAMVGLCLALISAGVFTDITQVGPIILGACIGTCIVPIMASLSMRIGARRAAFAHLLFNLLNVPLALLVWPLLVAFCRWSSSDLLRQTANLHTATMCFSTLVLLPFTRAFTWLLLRLTPSSEPDPVPSFLDDKFLFHPEQALTAAIRELHRMGDLCVDSMIIDGKMMLGPTRALERALATNEDTINEVRQSMQDYLGRLARRKLSRRQTLFIQHLARCMKDIERIGDHLTHIGRISVERYSQDAAMVPEALFRTWFMLFCSAKRVVALMSKSFDPDLPDFHQTALEILRARDAYTIQSMDAKADFVGAARDRQITSVAGFYLSRYIENLDRLVRRAKSIALAERQPDFWLKAARLDRESDELVDFIPQPRVDAKEYLELLAKENPLDDTDIPEVEPRVAPTDSPHDLDTPPPPTP